jgi:dihydroorotase
MLRAVANFTARQFRRAIAMPNLIPPITTVEAARAYRERILQAVDPEANFTPLMTCYLTESTPPEEVQRGYEEGVFTAVKLYPAHATTNSAHGVQDLEIVFPVLETMEKSGMPLLMHGEVTDKSVDIFDREKVFIDRVLSRILRQFPGLKVVFEHITTSDAVDFVESAGPNLGATITPHHLHINRNAMFDGGIRPHFYCLPVAKRESHRLALRKAATSGSPRYFLGTDSAPHAISAKESACGCAGVFNAPYALESYLKAFEEERALERFEAFASENGARFYGLPLNEGTITLNKAVTTVPPIVGPSELPLVPFHSGEMLSWVVDFRK